MRKLCEYLQNTENLQSFFDKVFFDRHVDFLVIHDDDIFHVFEKQEVWQVLIRELEVCNNRSCQKVTLRYKGCIIGEIEVRNTND